MIYAEILAAGKGKRMGNINTPKQYLGLNNKPILIHTIERFLLNSKFDKIIIVTPKEWINYTNDIIKRHIGYSDLLVVVEGGEDRTESIMNGIKYISETYGINEDDIIVTHDAVRPFLTHRIIEENIHYAREYGAVDTVVNAVDTIIQSEDGEFIFEIPRRDMMYQGQTPQSFKITKLVELYNMLTKEQKEILTDACKIFTYFGENVKIVKGEVFNIKITTPFDMKVAKAFLQESN